MYYLLNHKKTDKMIIVKGKDLDDYGENWEIIDVRKHGVGTKKEE